MSDSPAPSASGRAGLNGALLAAGALVAVYLFLPVIFVAPIRVMQQEGIISDRASDALVGVFAPLSYLTRHSPAYDRMLEEEWRLFGRWFPKYDPWRM